MVEYAVRFVTRISAKSKDDLNRKAERIANSMTMCIGKKVTAYDYGEIEKRETIKHKDVDEDGLD